MISPFKSKYEGNLDSTYIPQYAIGAPTSPQTANQIAEATSRLNAGVYGVDLALIDERLFETVPKQHFKEIDRLMKLTGAKATIHGPIVDLAGFSQQGWQEEHRKETERKINYYLDMAHETDPKGNTPINFHINTLPIGDTWDKVNGEELKKTFGVDPRKYDDLPEIEKKSIRKTHDPITGKDEFEVKRLMYAVDPELGQLAPLKYEVKQFVHGPAIYNPDKQLELINDNNWDTQRERIYTYQKQKAEIQDRMKVLQQEAQPLEYGEKKGVLTEQEQGRLNEIKGSLGTWEGHIKEIDKHIDITLNNLYHDLKYVPKEYQDRAEKLKKTIKDSYEGYQKRREDILEKYHKGLATQQDIDEFYKIGNKQNRELQLNLETVGIKRREEKETYIPAPYKLQSTNEFAKDKTAETVSNVVFEAYKKYKDNAPLMLLENLLPEGTLGSAEDLKNTVEESRKRLRQKLMKEKNMNRDEADKVAEKLIGVTWDVGHINFMRKRGYSEKDVIEETKKIAPYIKQVHITDNFGFNDAHLPPGMGNAPIKEEMEVIAKEMRKKGLDFKKGSVIVEAGAFVAQFKEHPHPYTLEYFESPLYTYKTMPYWKEIWETEAPYGLGYGQILPEQHFQMYGAGFSNLPTDLGGPITQDRSRFAGTPNA